MRYTWAEQSGTAYSVETVIGFVQRDIVYMCCMLVHTYTTQNQSKCIGIQTMSMLPSYSDIPSSNVGY